MKRVNDIMQRVFATLCPFIGAAYGWRIADLCQINALFTFCLAVFGLGSAWLLSAYLINVLEKEHA